MISVNDLRKGDTIVSNKQPHKVMDASHMKKARQGATVSVKLKNLVTGTNSNKTFNSNERLEEADLDKRNIEFIYNHRGEYVFCKPGEKSQRFSFKKEKLGDKVDFLKEGLQITAEYFGEDLVNIILPIKVEYKVASAPPNVKGNTAGAATKTVTIETGAQIQTPMFISQGDTISINTEKGEYVERVSKK